MFFTWDDRKSRGKVGELTILVKPELSFEYTWILVNDLTAQYVESRAPNVFNKDLSESQLEEVTSFAESYEPPTPKPIVLTGEQKRQYKLMELSSYFSVISQRPIIDTGYGFSVQAGFNDLASFQVGVDLGLLEIRAADNTMHSVTKEQFENVLLQIKQNGARLMNIKWTIEDEIKHASIEELEQINFEERFND